MTALLSIILIFSLSPVSAQAPDPATQLSNVPEPVQRVLINGPLAKDYELSFHLNPFYLRGDFNGDGKADLAVLVKHRTTGKLGVAIVEVGSTKVVILGAGRGIGAGGDDLAWMDYWYVYPKGPVMRGAGEGAVPRLVGEALLVGKSESGSGLVYWDGKRYVWYQQGD